MEIYVEDNSELAEYEALNKGYRNDVYVKISVEYFKLSGYDLVRLSQDFESELNDYGYYCTEANLILVKEVSFLKIKETVDKLYKQKYFHNLKPIEKEKLPPLYKIAD